jgi:murein DD-endopeptidase MepM/ murein hydrolase activator NlpD
MPILHMMSASPRGLIACLVGTLLLLTPNVSVAHAAGAGGVEADPGSVTRPPAGGAEYGSASLRPVMRVRAVRLIRTRVLHGSSPRLAVRIDRRGASKLRLRITLTGAHGTRTLPLRHIAAGRTVVLRLPRSLRVGAYRVRLVARGKAGDLPVRSRGLRLVVRARPKARPRPKTHAPPAPAAPAPAPAPNAPASPVPPSLGGPGLTSGVFPVRGTSTLGGKDARFGAGRTGHKHEGQDILAASGTPVVAPLAGQILFNDYQAGGAGRYVVLHAANGWEMFFAHCLAGSATLKAGAAVSAGDQLCLVGATGDATGPHLHFELWPAGWREVKGTRPVDPLPQLQRWATG